MVEIRTRDDVSLDEPVLIEGMPGVGLVGKIAADHVLEQLDMVEYGEIVFDGPPTAVMFDQGDRGVKSAIRLFADPETDTVVLQSAIPFEVVQGGAFVTAFTDWVEENDVLPLYLSGVAAETEPGDIPELHGLATGEATTFLDDADVAPPANNGLIQGPGGAFLFGAKETGVDAVGLMVESDPRFPDPQGAKTLIDEGIEPIANITVNTERLVEEAEQIMDQREELMERLQQATEEGQKVSTRGMYQ